jgi:hypothetical protein
VEKPPKSATDKDFERSWNVDDYFRSRILPKFAVFGLLRETAVKTQLTPMVNNPDFRWISPVLYSWIWWGKGG